MNGQDQNPIALVGSVWPDEVRRDPHEAVHIEAAATILANSHRLVRAKKNGLLCAQGLTRKDRRSRALHVTVDFDGVMRVHDQDDGHLLAQSVPFGFNELCPQFAAAIRAKAQAEHAQANNRSPQPQTAIRKA